MLFKKIFKTIIWVFPYLIMGLMISLLLLFINLPGIMESQIVKRLPQFIDPQFINSGDIEFKIRNLGFSNTHISKIRLFKSISIDSINIDYGFQDLLSSFPKKNIESGLKSGDRIDIEQVTISGLNIHAAIDENRQIKIDGLDFPGTSKNQSTKDGLPFLPYLPQKIVIENSKIIVHVSNDKLNDEFIIPFDLTSLINIHDQQITLKIKLYPFGETINGLVTYDIDKGVKAVEIQGKAFDIGHLNQFISNQTDRLLLKGLLDFNIESSSPEKQWIINISNIALIQPVEAAVKDIKANILIDGKKIDIKGFINIFTPLLPETILKYGMSVDLQQNNSFVLNLETKETDDFKIEYNSNIIAVQKPVLTAHFKGVPGKNRGKILINSKNINIQNKKDNIAFNDLKITSNIAVNLNKNSSQTNINQINSNFTMKTNNINFHSDLIDSSFPKADISGAFLWDSKHLPSFNMVLKTYEGKATVPKYKIKISDIDIKIPVSYPKPDIQLNGEYSVASILYDNKYDFSTKGEIVQINSDRFNINGNMAFKLFPDIKTQFNSSVGLEKNSAKASAKFKTNSFQLNESDIKKLGLQDIPNAQFDVTAFIKGRADYADHNLKSSMQLGINKGKVFMPDNNLSMDGINTNIQFNDLLSLNSVPGQILTIDTIAVNKIKLSNAKVRFSMEQGKSLLVENIKFKWCNGLVSTEAIRFPQKNGEYAMSLYCDRLELTQLLKQMGVFDAEGTGTLNGRIPVVYSNGNISFDNGFLFSTPGSGGKVKIDNAERITSGIPMDTPQFSQLDLAQEALKDFNYKWAKLKFHTKKDTLFVNMELDGEPSKLLPFEYSKEFGGFVRVDASSPGSHFQGIKLDVNLKLPFNEVLKSGNKLKSIFD
jgi:hypothetical protein